MSLSSLAQHMDLAQLTLIFFLLPWFSTSSNPQDVKSRSDDISRAKRYERLMKSHGIQQNQGGGTTARNAGDDPTPSPRRKAPAPAGPTNKKKRKLDDLTETRSSIDDDEGGLFDNVKAESGNGIKIEKVEAERV